MTIIIINIFCSIPQIVGLIIGRSLRLPLGVFIISERCDIFVVLVIEPVTVLDGKEEGHLGARAPSTQNNL